jgi:hypothetical protein
VRAKIIEMDADRRRLSLSLKRVGEEDEARQLAGAPALGLSDEVFSEGTEEGGEQVFSEGTEEGGEQVFSEATEEPSDLPPEEVDESIDADRVAPEAPGPGDSDAGYPAAPDDEPE